VLPLPTQPQLQPTPLLPLPPHQLIPLRLQLPPQQTPPLPLPHPQLIPLLLQLHPRLTPLLPLVPRLLQAHQQLQVVPSPQPQQVEQLVARAVRVEKGAEGGSERVVVINPGCRRYPFFCSISGM
jgi:hypothetical protein